MSSVVCSLYEEAGHSYSPVQYSSETRDMMDIIPSDSNRNSESDSDR
jgi:hypothetical protein